MLLGLVGKPNVGKSTFFKAATLSEVLIANYPFATIKPNHGIGYVKVECIDKELNVQCQPRTGFCLEHKRFVPIELMDVAGLVPGASTGKGLGNQFLDDLRQADLFIHIADASGKTTIEGKQVSEGEVYDPCKDLEFLDEELDTWYLGILNKVWKTFSRTISAQQDINFAEAVAKQFSGLKIDEYMVKDAVLKIGLDTHKAAQWTEEELKRFAHELRSISKPMIIAANKCDAPGAKENIEKMKDNYPNLLIVPCSADSELALREAAKSELIHYIPGENNFEIKKELSPRQKQALRKIRENVLDVYGSTGVQQVLDTAIFELLKYIAIFPAGVNKLADSDGNILPDCFLLPKGSTALDFAYHLHTDIGDNFIKAIDARTGKAVGKEHELQHRDALEIATR
jgi:ribosome-binding ATPase YchF (GTP1/OBG family)